DRNNQKKMMMETEVHKFSDGTLTRTLEKLDHMDKDYVLFKFNLGMEHIIWSEDDKRRSKEFIEVIERRLKIKKNFKSLKSFVSGSKDGNPARANIKQALGSKDGNPARANIKQALGRELWLLQPYSMKVNKDSLFITNVKLQVFLTVAAGSRRQVIFITTCSYSTDTSQDIMKDQKACFETYVKSKDIDPWQVMQNGDFYFEVEYEETKLMKEMPYELLKDIEKKQLGRANNKFVLALTSFLRFCISSVVITIVLPFIFVELSLAGPLPVSSGGAL
nr:hypothetical protein [Tanacetum cinerariifolium]